MKHNQLAIAELFVALDKTVDWNNYDDVLMFFVGFSETACLRLPKPGLDNNPSDPDPTDGNYRLMQAFHLEAHEVSEGIEVVNEFYKMGKLAAQIRSTKADRLTLQDMFDLIQKK